MKATILSLLLVAVVFANPTHIFAVDVTLGTWLEEDPENLSSVSGSGDTFTATPADSSGATDPFPARQKVYQIFDQPADFSTQGQEVRVTFDIVMNGVPDINDSDLHVSLVDTSTNQGFFPIGWDLGGRAGTYSRSRFVDNLDGPGGGEDGFAPWGGSFVESLSASGTIASTGGAPTIENGAEELGLVQGNTVHFDFVMRREAGNGLSYSLSVNEANGDVVYPEHAGAYDPVNPTSGDTDVRGEAVNQWDGIVFGIFDDVPFLRPGDYDEDGDVDGQDFLDWQRDTGQGSLADWEDDYGTAPSYTVSNISITATALVPPPAASTSVPEPSSLLLLVLGASGLLRISRRN